MGGLQHSAEGRAPQVEASNSQMTRETRAVREAEKAKADLALVRHQMQKLEEELEFLRKSAEGRQNDLRQMSLLIQDKNDDQQKRLQQIQRKEERLARYAKSLSTWRLQTKALCAELIQEVQTARNLHPLKDYLLLTEAEIGKVELRLLKASSGSPERIELEKCAGELFEQRDFLRTTIENSLKQIESQAQTLARIFESDHLTSLPPLPPLGD